jgi:RNA recognition motif-containing protein
MNIYVGNLSTDTVEDDIKKAFEAYGAVDTVNILKDRYSGLTRGFGFLEMSVQSEAKSAIEALNGSNIKGKNIIVNEALPKKDFNDSDRYDNNNNRRGQYNSSRRR